MKISEDKIARIGLPRNDIFYSDTAIVICEFIITWYNKVTRAVNYKRKEARILDIKYQIFISSTYKDLIPEREKVRDVILSMYQFPIGMEMFSAADEEQWKIIISVKDCLPQRCRVDSIRNTFL